MAATEEIESASAVQAVEDPRFQTDNSMSTKKQPKQQLSKSMAHMRFAVTVDPLPPPPSPQPQSQSQPQPSKLPSDPPISTSSPSLHENDAYGVPSSIAPLRHPSARSHSPSNNQKRSDPFAFGSRVLEEGDNIFEFNAWDHVTVDPSYTAFSAQQYAAQRASPVSDFDRERFNRYPERWWNTFYKNNRANFFKDRKWLAQEFPVLDELGREGGPEAVLLEVGAGAGNSAFPILQRSRNKRLKVHACDFSKVAVEVMRGNPICDGVRMRADVWDAASAADAENGGLPPGLSEGSVDVVLMVFIFSALSPAQWDACVHNIWRVLKPGGQVLFRDYGRGDLAQVRFKKGRWMEENFYVRGDGTRVYFFERDELERIWTGKNTKFPEDKAEDISLKHEPENTENSDITVATSTLTPDDRPAFETAHIGVDRRMLVNRQRRLKMYRCWLQAVFRKPGGESAVPVSDIRQSRDEEGEESKEAEGSGSMREEGGAGAVTKEDEGPLRTADEGERAKQIE